jgi:hypothetical protein
LDALAADESVSLMERILALQDAGEVNQAWQLAGVRLESDIEDPATFGRAAEQGLPEVTRAMVPAVLARARTMLTAPAAPQRVVLIGPSTVDLAVIELRLVGDTVVTYGTARSKIDPHRVDPRDGYLPRVVWHRLPDLEMLRSGLLAADEVHPLVRAALFPDQHDPGYRPRIGAAAVVSTLEDQALGWAGEVLPVQCGDPRHRIGFRHHRIEALDHEANDLTRERAIAALGAPARACVAAIDAWRSPVPMGHKGQVVEAMSARHSAMPPTLAALLRHALNAVAHGNTEELARLLDAGLDPYGVRDSVGRGLLHHLGKLPPEDASDASGLLGPLVAAGLDLNEAVGDSPLRTVLNDGGSSRLVHAMIDAGAAAVPAQPRR